MMLGEVRSDGADSELHGEMEFMMKNSGSIVMV